MDYQEGNEMENDQRKAAPNRREALHAATALTLAAASVGSSAGASRSLEARLRGVQHVGVTVENMNRAFEFYTEVLGGTEVMRDGNFQGELIHNTLLLHEEPGLSEFRAHLLLRSG